MGRPIRHHVRTDVAALRTHKAIAEGLDGGAIWQMADIHDRAVIAMAGIAIDQKVTATLGSHMAQSHGCQLSNFDRRHASQHPHSGKTTPRGHSTTCLC